MSLGVLAYTMDYIARAYCRIRVERDLVGKVALETEIMPSGRFPFGLGAAEDRGGQSLRVWPCRDVSLSSAEER